MTEIKMPSKKLLKDIINYAETKKLQGLSVGSMPLKQHVHRHLYKFDENKVFSQDIDH